MEFTNISVNFDHLCDFIDIFEDQPAVRSSIKNAWKESTKPKMQLITCYSISTIHKLSSKSG